MLNKISDSDSHVSFLTLIRLNYDNGFHNTLDYNHSIYRDYLLCTVTASAHIML